MDPVCRFCHACVKVLMSSGSVCALPFWRLAAALVLPGCVSRLGHMTSAGARPDHERKHDGGDDDPG